MTKKSNKSNPKPKVPKLNPIGKPIPQRLNKQKSK